MLASGALQLEEAFEKASWGTRHAHMHAAQQPHAGHRIRRSRVKSHHS